MNIEQTNINSNNSNLNSQCKSGNNNNLVINNESQLEYSLCGLFSILYPFSLNFENNANELDKESFIPKLENPPSWHDLTEQSESLDPSSDYSSDCEMSDISTCSSQSSISPFYSTTTSNKNQPQQPTPPKSSKSKPKIKKLFIGGIKFDDLSNDQFLKSKRIQKITQLFHSFGKIEKLDPHWDKGYLFVNYYNPKVSQKVFSTFNNPAKKLKILQKIKESLKNENIDVKCTPTPTIYIRFPSNNNK